MSKVGQSISTVAETEQVAYRRNFVLEIKSAGL